MHMGILDAGQAMPLVISGKMASGLTEQAQQHFACRQTYGA